MILTNTELKQLDNEIFDACIIGTGPAGVSVALGLESKGQRILLLEAGDTEFTEKSQSHYRGAIIGDKYFGLDVCRLRYLGGSSNHWAGKCRTLDEVDFQAKNGFPATEWPIAKKDIDPYLEKASEILGLPEIPADSKLETDELKSISFVQPPPVNFKLKYSQYLHDSDSILLATNANVTSFTPNYNTVKTVNIRCCNGSAVKIQARRYILATGGIENSRLLLWSNFLANGELIKNARTLGRYWMEHPHAYVCDAFINANTKSTVDPHIITSYSPTNALMKSKKVLNCGLNITPIPNYEGTQKMIQDLMCIAPRVGNWASYKLKKGHLCGAKVYAASEQEPVIDNRIELSEEKDKLDVPRTNLFWKKNENDLRTCRIATEALGRYISSNNLGRLHLNKWLRNDEGFPDKTVIGGHHHLGGTRMASSPEQGIVDKNCKVHGMNNLFIAGSSVFPSGGHANPTLPIVQMALRLAHYLRKS